MTPVDDRDEHAGIVAAGTRRIVGRAALCRLAGMAGEWQDEEAAKCELAGRLARTITRAALIAGGQLIWFYR